MSGFIGSGGGGGGSGDVVGPSTHSANYVPQWNGTPNSKTLISGFAITDAGKAILDDADSGAQRTTLGLGDSATLDVGTSAGTVASGNDARFSDARDPTSHASDHTDGTDDIQNATAGQKGLMTATQASKLDGIEANATADMTGAEIKAAYESEADTNAYTDAEKTKLSGVETGADVTDATNVDAAGATMNTDTDVSGNSWVLDEDNMATDSAEKVPTQQSVKAYVDAVAGSGSGFDWTTENDVTTDQTPATSDLGERYLYTQSTAASRTLTLPSVGADENGEWLAVTNASDYVITVSASDSDTIGWPELNVQSVDMLPNSHVCLRYDHSRTKWDVVSKTGGAIHAGGLRLYAKMDEQTIYSAGDSTYAFTRDSSDRHNVWTYSAPPTIKDGKFNSAIELDGTADYIFAVDSTDWDFFGSSSGDYTAAGWFYFDDATSSGEVLFGHYEDASNRWYTYRSSGGGNEVGVYFDSSGSAEIAAYGGSASGSNWHHIALVKVGSDVGIYVNGSQVAYDGAWTPDTFAGNLVIGQNGASSSYMDGRICDFAIVAKNIFGASPNSTPDDSFTVPANPLDLVI